ncbi:MAG: nucleoside phosphorylase [Caldisphaera sp.]
MGQEDFGKKVGTATRPLLKGGKQYHINCKSNDVSEYVFLSGESKRIPKISSYWDKITFKSAGWDYIVHTGYYKGVRLSAASTGIGGPSTAIVMEELMRCGARTFIRVGTIGALVKDISTGDLIISTGAVRLDGTTKQYVMAEYPALANYEIIQALVSAALKMNFKFYTGITASADGFYVGQGRPGFNEYFPSFAKNILSDLKMSHVIGMEMENSTVFTLSNIYGLRGGSICAVAVNRETDEFEPRKGVDKAIKVANEAVLLLVESDKKNRSYAAER